MENYEEYKKTAQMYCSVYAKIKPQPISPTSPISENKGKFSPMKQEPVKLEEAAKKEGVLGALTLNPHTGEQHPHAKQTKAQGQIAGDKKKWMKRIQIIRNHANT
eukprot:TRINITY_DN1503_c0_g3_i5.p3 TRINITY_DN1503_c0_g3~~TRINITY_DN1503_c0_g3_i5.p3  ORF type:complete len:105 (-),score=30.82 TRINITY_DN1503_c0_g3_i5:81-395(-)